MKQLQLALRLLYRDGRSGELTILVLALLIAVTSASAISLFADRLQRTMEIQAAEFLAADLVIASPTVIPRSWRDKAASLGLRQAETAEFSTVLMENQQLLLAGIKAVSPGYPLRGQLKITTGDYHAEQVIRAGPKPGEAWVARRILAALQLHLGDNLQVGEKKLRITRIITYEPDQRGDLYSLSPRVMMHAADLAATRVLQPGSHVHRFFQFAGSTAALRKFNRWVKPHLNPSQRLMDIHDDRPEIGAALRRAEQYLGLSSIVVILIAGVAIAMATRRYSQRHFDSTAILRCLGCRQRTILLLYSSQFIVLGIAASAAGCLLGWFAQEGLFQLLRNLLPQTVASPGPLALLFGFITGMATLLGFALPPLLRLKRVSPLRVLRRELQPLPSSAWLVYGLAMTVIAVLIWRYTQNPKLTAAIIGVGLLTFTTLGAALLLLLSASRGLLAKLPLQLRFGLQGLIRQRQASVGQILAFSITLVAMILSFTVRNDLLDNWRAQLPENAPNHFLLNIFPEQKDALQQDLRSHDISGSRFYPVVRGRLVGINDVPVQQIVSRDSQGEQATHRDLSLTWSGTLPEENKIVSGRWWTRQHTHLVSIEQGLAKSLKVGLGDRLTFTVGSQQFNARVSSIRHVDWDTMKPNFYMIFPPGTLDAYSNTYITSFYLPQEKKLFLNTLVKKYPGITVLEVDLLVKQFKRILAQISQAIDYLLGFALLAGVMVLFAALYASLDERIHDGALLRTLGATRRLLRSSQFIEFFTLGLLASLLAVIISEVMLYVLYSQVLNIDYQPNWLLWLLLPVSGGVFIGLLGCWGVRKVVNESPVVVLREQ